jgi:hypothetical protein
VDKDIANLQLNSDANDADEQELQRSQVKLVKPRQWWWHLCRQYTRWNRYDNGEEIRLLGCTLFSRTRNYPGICHFASSQMKLILGR